jgi:hypothetical protein
MAIDVCQEAVCLEWENDGRSELSKLASKSGFMGSHPLMEWKGTNFKEIGLGYLTLVGIGVRARLPPGLTRISCSLL